MHLGRIRRLARRGDRGRPQSRREDLRDRRADLPVHPRVSRRPGAVLGVYAAGRWGSLDAQWDEIKGAVSEAIIAAGGTITHHHAVGRDHRRWYDRQRPDPFAAGLHAAKSALDPAGILNPGVLVDP